MPLSKHGMELSTDDLPSEKWKKIPGYSDYKVSNLGRVKSLKRNKERILSPGLNGEYLYVQLSDGEQRIFLIHILVMKTFVGECPEGYEVNHIDLNKCNNKLKNLEYVTHIQNIVHSVLNNGRHFVGSDNANRIIEYFTSHNSEITYTAMSQNFGISAQTIKSILKGHRSYYNTLDLTKGHVGAKVTPSIVNEIKQLLAEGWKQAKIAEKFNVDPAVITRIKNDTYYNRKGTK